MSTRRSGSGFRISIPRRNTRQKEPTPPSEPEPEPDTQPTSENEDEEQANDEADGEDAPAESDAPEESGQEDNDENKEGSGEEAPKPIVRGRPRGRPRGSGRGRVDGGPGRPRGRPRGSGRGRGRPRGRGGLTRISRGDGSDDDGRATPGGDSEYENPHGPNIKGDEYITEDDPKGDEKIDAMGNLLGGRQFKAHTFVLPDRHSERKYMLAIDAARSSGFRDSLYYFRRNPLAYKLIASQSEKDFLIEIGKLGGHLRTRSVTLVTARSAFKLHGSKMLIDGRIGIDDYYEEKAIKEAEEKGLKAGDFAAELLEQQQVEKAEASQAASKQERSGLGLYRTGGPTTVFGGAGLGPYSDGPLNVGKKAMLNREGATEENWMFVMAQRTREANSEWLRGRLEAVKGYEEPEEDEDAMMARTKRRRRDASGPTVGVYEAHTAIPHCKLSSPLSTRFFN